MFESPPYFVFPIKPDAKFVHGECGEGDPSDENTRGMTVRQLYKALALQGILAANPGIDVPDVEEIVRNCVLAAARFADAQIAEDKKFEKKGTDE